jgi:hypothetical protein
MMTYPKYLTHRVNYFDTYEVITGTRYFVLSFTAFVKRRRGRGRYHN